MTLKLKLSRCPAVDCAEINEREALGRRELGVFDPAFDHLAFALDQFQFAEPQKILNMIFALCRALVGQLAIFALEGWQPQSLEVKLQQDLWGVAHAGAPDIRLM
jgi:hypothetical protein